MDFEGLYPGQLKFPAFFSKHGSVVIGQIGYTGRKKRKKGVRGGGIIIRI